MFISKIWLPAIDIENLRYWYMKYFAMTSSAKKRTADGMAYYELSNGVDSCKLIVSELREGDNGGSLRLSIAVESKQGVDFLTELLRTDGNEVVFEPMVDENGAYKSGVVDPEGNLIFITE